MAIPTTRSVFGQIVDIPMADYILKASSSAITTIPDMERFVLMLASGGAYETYAG